MHVLQKLFETYENNQHEVGKITKTIGKNGKEYIKTLLPVFHRTKQTDIEFTLNEHGQLVDVSCGTKTIIIPVTLQSSNRTNGHSLHPIHDNLKNIAFDSSVLLDATNEQNEKGRKKTLNKEINLKTQRDVYIHNLEQWSAYDTDNWKVKAILTYMRDNKIISDLLNYGVIEHLGGADYARTINPSISNGATLGKTNEALLKNTIRFNVIHTKHEGLDVPLWEDSEFRDSFIAYYENVVIAESDFKVATCLITGEQQKIVPFAPKFIRDAGDRSKLVSINDENMDSKTGMFKRNTNARKLGELPGMGFIPCEKAFAALKWLLERQEVRFSDTHRLLVWGNSKDTTLTFNAADSILDILDTDMNPELAELNDLLLEVSGLEQTKDVATETGEAYAVQLRKALKGYKRTDISEDIDRDIYILRIDSFNSGRFFAKEFLPMKESAYVELMTRWQERGMWEQFYYHKDSNSRKSYMGVPAIKKILSFIVSKERKTDANKEITKISAELLACILNDKPIPQSILRNLEKQLLNPVVVSDKYAWDELLSLNCALHKNDYGRKGEHYTMALNKENTNRDYLFGRWLAVAHILEENVIRDSEKSRDTNAMRYLHAFQQRPATTLNIIANRLQPYKAKLAIRNDSLLSYYERLFDEILVSFDEADFVDLPLSARFHFGFSNQRKDIYTKNTDDVPVVEDENVTEAE